MFAHTHKSIGPRRPPPPPFLTPNHRRAPPFKRATGDSQQTRARESGESRNLEGLPARRASRSRRHSPAIGKLSNLSKQDKSSRVRAHEKVSFFHAHTHWKRSRNPFRISVRSKRPQKEVKGPVLLLQVSPYAKQAAQSRAAAPRTYVCIGGQTAAKNS